MSLREFLVFIGFFLIFCPKIQAQRLYASNSVLASGNWYKIGLTQEGVYKVDVNLLSKLGINTTNISSSSIRLYGNASGMLAENNMIQRQDDLFENPIEINDGGDGIFNGSDFFIFYAPGPNRWEKDSLNQLFTHRKNLYTDTATYFVTIGGIGKRIATQSIISNATVLVNSYDERYFYENDSINLLHSGKQWYGEEFATNLGGTLLRNFTINWPGLLLNEPLSIISDFAARSVGSTAGFLVNVNSKRIQTIDISGVSGNFLDPFANGLTQKNAFDISSSTLNLAIGFGLPNGPNINGAKGWLNWFELFGRRSLAVNENSQLFFRDWRSVANNSVANFTISNSTTASIVWEISEPLSPLKMNCTYSGTETFFKNDANKLREYVAFTNTNLASPFALEKVVNQNLHNSKEVDMIIITDATLFSEAQKLAQFHTQKDGYTSVVVTADQVYNEFSGGVADPTAIRDYVKMYFDKAKGDIIKRPKYLLLFGSASYDYKYRISGNVNKVPGYESVNSLDPLLTYTSDDFFGLLNDGDDINANSTTASLEIGIGRIPARNLMEAKTMVAKIIHYASKESLGSWRNQTVYVADDQDYNLHLSDAEVISENAKNTNPLFNQNKIFLDAFPLVSGSGGARYPKVNEAIVNQIFNGTLIFNYSGHGSYQRLAEEAILTQEELNRFNNPNKLPLFITATCDFAPHDDPQKNSLGASILTGNANGAIALLTTSRLVFAFSNKIINDNYLHIALEPDVNGKYLTLGESVRRTKNVTAQNFGDIINNRKFSLLGDPALRLSFPELKVQLQTINEKPLSGKDTLQALKKYTFTGQITDWQGNTQANFNGTVLPTIFDKPQQMSTLGNVASSPVTKFIQQNSVLYKGKASVSNGQFSFSFFVPKDINFQPGNARISLYAEDGNRDASGINNSFFVGGTSVGVTDDKGPQISPFLNDEKFKNGGLTNENAVLLVNLFDSTGISTSGNGIGHDITAIIDENERNVLVLNDFYTSLQDSYQKGQVKFQLPTLSEGKHSIKIKAWDVANNSSEETLHFVVKKQETLQITQVRNYPNPFTVSTIFAFEHNQPNTVLEVNIDIFSVSGTLMKQIKQKVNTGGTRNCEINWIGDNQSGAKLTKGIYIYRIIVVAGGSKTESTQQLILF